MSVGAPRAPADPWWIMIRAFGRARRFGSAAAEDHGGGRHTDAEADRRHLWANVLDDVVDRHPGVGHPARGVDVEGDVSLGVLRFEEEDLAHDQVGGLPCSSLAASGAGVAHIETISHIWVSRRRRAVAAPISNMR